MDSHGDDVRDGPLPISMNGWIFISIPIPIPSMGLVYLPNIYHKNEPNVGKYTSHMDGMGNAGNLCMTW